MGTRHRSAASRKSGRVLYLVAVAPALLLGCTASQAPTMRPLAQVAPSEGATSEQVKDRGRSIDAERDSSASLASLNVMEVVRSKWSKGEDPAAASGSTSKASSDAAFVSSRRMARPLPMKARPGSTPRDAVRSGAREGVRYASSLASRGAVYSAWEESVRVLSVLAHLLDNETGMDRHRRALRSGLVAIDEAEDFVRCAMHPAADQETASLVANHQTPILKGTATGRLMPLTALQQYYMFARDQLAIAGGKEHVASEALFSMGQLKAAQTNPVNPQRMLSSPQAIALYQAALMVDSQNSRAANELGVLLARCGHLGDARQLFTHSLSIAQEPEPWYNLSVVYERLGEAKMAKDALAAYERLLAERRTRQNSGLPDASGAESPMVRWVSAEEFARMPIEGGAAGPLSSGREVVPSRPATGGQGQSAAVGFEGKSTLHLAAYKDPLLAAAFPPASVGPVQLCQAVEEIPSYGPLRCGVDCPPDCSFCEPRWNARRPIPWEAFAHGEYVGPARTRHVAEYRIRVDDILDFVFRLTRAISSEPYRFEVGDVVLVESLVAPELDREITVGPDGMITLRQLGQVPAAGRSIEELQKDITTRYEKTINNPSVTVTPVKFNTRLDELRSAVDRRFGSGGQSRQVRVSPDGTVQLPAIGQISVQGLSLAELKREVDSRYSELVEGLEVTPILVERAPRFVYVLGEVRIPGRFVLEGPTTAMQAVALAGGWNVGAKLQQMVVFRRTEDWRLIATKLDLRHALWGKRPCPADEIWLRDSDLVLVPKGHLLLADDFIELVFTRGIYGVVPFGGISITMSKMTTI